MKEKKSDNHLFIESVIAATFVFALLCGAIAAVILYGWYGILGVIAGGVYLWMIDGIYENAKKIRDGDKK